MKNTLSNHRAGRAPLAVAPAPAIVPVIPLAIVLALGLTSPAQALETACAKGITQANMKLLDAPAFHQSKRFANTSLEIIKVDGKLFQRMGNEPWAASPLSLQDLRQGALTHQRLMQSCERDGADAVDGVAAEVYRLTVKGPGGAAVALKVWIGAADGLPYREEGADLKSSTSYRHVKAPL
ncbi:hypothetical protein AACH06_23870 [Ideonella sp. DXS29W]|uniref:Uncharacterized protein n=1 Tax=Ideonella lacteola TaxID=2984193 RepID=A0ABU9BVV0_9BURK